MKKKIAFMILSSLMIAGASYFTSKNQVLLLDEVEAEALTYYDTEYLPRPTWDDTDVHENFEIKNKTFQTTFTTQINPVFNLSTGEIIQQYEVVFFITTWHVTCCMEGDGPCDFGKDLAACANNISGYIHPSHNPEPESN